MPDPNSSSLYLPIDTTLYPDGWPHTGLGQPTFEITKAQTIAYTDSSITFTVEFVSSVPAGVAFGCTLASINSCTVNGSVVSVADNSPLYYMQSIGPAVGGGYCYTSTLPAYIYYNPVNTAKETITLEIKFSNFNIDLDNNLWVPCADTFYDNGTTYGCAFLLFSYFTGPDNGTLAAAYPFNLLAGPSPKQNLRDRLDCSPCPCCPAKQPNS